METTKKEGRGQVGSGKWEEGRGSPFRKKRCPAQAGRRIRRLTQKKREWPENNKFIVAVNCRPVFHFKRYQQTKVNRESSRNIIPHDEN
jgi:hypothetical protein